MAYDDATAARIRWLLADRTDIAERKMMGSLCFLASGTMCCAVSGKGGLLIRIPPASRAQVLAEPHVHPMDIGHRTMQGFVRVSPVGYDSDDALRDSVMRGIDAVLSAPKKKKGKRAAGGQGP